MFFYYKMFLKKMFWKKMFWKKKIINKDKVLNSEIFVSFKLIEYVGGKV